jgi:hypothetical protein
MWIIKGLRGLNELIRTRLQTTDKMDKAIKMEIERLVKAMELLLKKDGDSEEEADVVLLIGVTTMVEALMARITHVNNKLSKDCKKELTEYFSSIKRMVA